jgi:SLOG cluster4 family
MSRKLIIAAIGGNGMPDVAASAHRFGELLSDRAILLTGGEPNAGVPEVKCTALAGSEKTGKGLMISVLTHGNPTCERRDRRLILQTGVGKYERDPITGSAADVVVAFSGGAGTLIELAYAAFQNRPIIFLGSIRFLRMNCCFEANEVKGGLGKALKGYSLISPPTSKTTTQVDELMNALVSCLAGPQGICVDTPEEAAKKIFGLFDRVSLKANTNFLGLATGKNWKNEFDAEVATLSGL